MGGFKNPTRRMLTLVAGAALAGCQTLTQDINELGQSLVPTTPSEAARMMIDPHDPDNRRRGTVIISNSPFGGADAYLALYRERVDSEPDPLVKAASITALARYGEPDDAPAIAVWLAHEQFQVRWEAIKALQRLHNPVVVGDLLRVLRDHDEHPDGRVAAAIALGQYPQDRVFQGLVGALEAQELAINMAACRSLETLTGEDHGFEAGPWLRWYNGVEDPFTGGREYYFPTYQRDETWLEKLTFWSSKNYEKPAPPAGLGPGPRRTYSDNEKPADETGG